MQFDDLDDRMREFEGMGDEPIPTARHADYLRAAPSEHLMPSTRPAADDSPWPPSGGPQKRSKSTN